VDVASDRMGIRLAGPPVTMLAGRELLTEGVALGAVQIPPAGLPIVLFVEHQTTGGYAKIANVIAADLARLSMLSPGDPVRFEPVSLAEARALLRRQEEAIDALLA
jgi:antagonist of KipI